MRALVHPDRVAILLFLLAAPTRTATECAAEIGVTPSACSYHLRELERFGYVERAAPEVDGRTRPWRAAAVGFSLGDDWSDDSPDGRAARHAIGRAELAENHRLIERFLNAADDMEPTWQAASEFHNFELMVTPAELAELNEQVAAVLRPFRAPARTDPPADAGGGPRRLPSVPAPRAMTAEDLIAPSLRRQRNFRLAWIAGLHQRHRRLGPHRRAAGVRVRRDPIRGSDGDPVRLPTRTGGAARPDRRCRRRPNRPAPVPDRHQPRPSRDAPAAARRQQRDGCGRPTSSSPPRRR